MTEGRARTVLLWLGGPLVWAVHFVVLYGAEALICTGTDAPSRAGWFVPIAAVATAVALAVLLGMLARWFVRRRAGRAATADSDVFRFLRETSAAMAALALLGVLWAAWPALLLPACAVPA